MKKTTKTIRELKGIRPIVAVTAYDAIMAKLADEADVDLILVGDSVGTTLLGMETTIPVTLEMMLHHTAAVVRAKPKALVVTDIPFPEAHRSIDALLQASARCLQEAGAEAVKIEGGSAMADCIASLTAAGIPVLGHIGLLPQQVLQLGGYRKFGKTDAGRQRLIDDARAVEAAGAFAIVIEMTDSETTEAIVEATSVPIIGIGAGPTCDGQILVAQDLLGLTLGHVPSFVKKYADIGDEMRKAFRTYTDEVRNRKFPS